MLTFVFGDPELCTGCMICTNVCSMHYFKVISPEQSRVEVIRIEPGLDFPLFCRNCEDASCIEVCPEEALMRTSKGIIIVNNKKCTGCGLCVKSCPYNAIKINPDTQKAIKCIQCGECIDRCPVDAIWLTNEIELAQRDSDNRIRSHYDKHADDIFSKEVS